MSRPAQAFDSSDRERIVQVAQDWLGRHDAGLTDREEAEFFAWLEADPRHADAFARLEATSHTLDQLASFRPADASSPDPDLPLRPTARHRRRTGWVPVALAAAAAIALAYVAGWRPLSSASPYAEIAQTAIGDLRILSLPDGSAVQLNTDSAIEVAYTRDERRVTLVRGEAHFVVAKDTRRPFIVAAGDIGVRAVGTAFNVRLRPETIEVLVTEGRVRVNDTARGASLLPAVESASTEPPVLSAGHRALIAADRTSVPVVIASVSEEEIARHLAWQTKRLEFSPTPLREVVAEFNRYNAHQLVIGDVETGALQVGGTFEASAYDALVRLLESSFGVTAESRDGQTILRKKP